MITLAKHIELLLLEHDCVIIPGFGGFISNHSEAMYEEDGGMLTPPTRTIGFNQQLQINDGLLVQSYMSAYDASYPAAHLQMEKDIEKMSRELDINGYYDLEAIGRLTKGMGAGISFEACTRDILTPSLYGLSHFSMQPVKEIIKKREIEARMQAASIGIRDAQPHEEEQRNTDSGKKRGIVIRLNPKAVEMSVAAAAAILLFFVTSYMATRDYATESDTVIAATYPLANSQNINGTDNTAKIEGAPTLQKDRTKSQSTSKTSTKKSGSAKSGKPEGSNTKSTEKQHNEKSDNALTNNDKDHKIDLSKQSNEPIVQTQEKALTDTGKESGKQAVASTPKYTIVLASYVTKANADSYIKNMAKEGFSEAEYIKKGKVSRIVYSGYATELEAQNALSMLRKRSKEFNEAWVMAY